MLGALQLPGRGPGPGSWAHWTCCGGHPCHGSYSPGLHTPAQRAGPPGAAGRWEGFNPLPTEIGLLFGWAPESTPRTGGFTERSGASPILEPRPCCGGPPSCPLALLQTRGLTQPQILWPCCRPSALPERPRGQRAGLGGWVRPPQPLPAGHRGSAPMPGVPWGLDFSPLLSSRLPSEHGFLPWGYHCPLPQLWKGL